MFIAFKHNEKKIWIIVFLVRSWFFDRADLLSKKINAFERLSNKYLYNFIFHLVNYLLNIDLLFIYDWTQTFLLNLASL